MKLSDTLKDIDLKQIVKKSIDTARSPELTVESYVSKEKNYNQTTEYVSEKTKEAHKKLYLMHLEKSNRVSAELDSASRSLDDVNSAHSNYRSLKLDETSNLNSKWLHELYFANCFDPHSEVYLESLSYMRLQRDFGTFDDWQKDMMACATACGNGWAVTAYHMHLQRYVNTIISVDSHDVMMGLYPILVIDMHEHAYFRDRLTNKKDYLIAMMREINWSVVEERIKKSEAIATVLK